MKAARCGLIERLMIASACLLVGAFFSAENRTNAAIWETAGPRLLLNGGFEQAMAKWCLGGEKATVACDEQVFHSGRRSLRIVAPGRPGGIRVVGFAKVNPIKMYRVMFAAKALDLRPASIQSVDGYGFDRASKPRLVDWSISGREATIHVPATGEVQVKDALGSLTSLSPRDGQVALKLSDLPVCVIALAGGT